MTFGAVVRAAFGAGAGGACCASAGDANAATPAAAPIVRIAARRETGPLPSRANASSFMSGPSNAKWDVPRNITHVSHRDLAEVGKGGLRATGLSFLRWFQLRFCANSSAE